MVVLQATYDATMRVWDSRFLYFLGCTLLDDPDVEDSSNHKRAEDAHAPPVACGEHERHAECCEDGCNGVEKGC